MEGTAEEDFDNDNPKKVYFVDTKGSCFMCLREIICTSAGDLISPILPFKLLLRYLNLKSEEVLKLVSTLVEEEEEEGEEDHHPSGLLENAELGVSLCGDCASVTEQFCELYQRLEAIRMDMDACVRNVLQVMEAADRDKEVSRKYRERIGVGVGVGGTKLMAKSSEGTDKIERYITDGLRKELITRCIIKTKSAAPQVRLSSCHDTDDTTSTTGQPIPTVKLDDAPTDSSGAPIIMLSDDEMDNEDEEPEQHNNSNGGVAMFNLEEMLEQSMDTVTDNEFPSSSRNVIGSKDQEEVTFEILPDGKYECQVCFKVVKALTAQYHRLTHSGQKPFKCQHCDATFRNPQHTNHHTYLHHRETFFMSWKSANVSLPRFRQLVTHLFANLEIPKDGRGRFTCCFCSHICNTMKCNVQRHMICVHLEEYLVPRLMAIQASEGGGIADHPEYPDDDDEDKEEEETVEDIQVELEVVPDNYFTASSSSSTFSSATALVLQSTPTYVPVPRKRPYQSSEPYECEHCGRSFRLPQHVKQHTYLHHRAAFFVQYKDSGISTPRFEGLVAELFSNLDIVKGPDGGFLCPFCNNISNTMKSNVQGHITRNHFDKLTLRLLEMQRAELTKSSGIPSSSSSSWSAPAGTNGRTSHSMASSSSLPIPSSSGGGGGGGGRAENEVTFSTLRKNKLQCHLCLKSVNSAEMESHRKLHSKKNPSAVPCSCCGATFGHTSNLKYHCLQKHLVSYFLGFRDFRIGKEQFGSIVEELFTNNLNLKQGEALVRGFECIYCGKKQYGSRLDIIAHLIQVHMVQLTPPLIQLQGAALLAEGIDLSTTNTYESASAAGVVVNKKEAKPEVIDILDSDEEEDDDDDDDNHMELDSSDPNYAFGF